MTKHSPWPEDHAGAESGRIVPATTIALIGYRGTGKTITAQLVALRLGYEWVDADVEIELVLGMSITGFFAESGEGRFREVESQVVAELCKRQRTVLALGGRCRPARREPPAARRLRGGGLAQGLASDHREADRPRSELGGAAS